MCSRADTDEPDPGIVGLLVEIPGGGGGDRLELVLGNSSISSASRRAEERIHLEVTP